MMVATTCISMADNEHHPVYGFRISSGGEMPLIVSLFVNSACMRPTGKRLSKKLSW